MNLSQWAESRDFAPPAEFCVACKFRCTLTIVEFRPNRRILETAVFAGVSKKGSGTNSQMARWVLRTIGS